MGIDMSNPCSDLHLYLFAYLIVCLFVCLFVFVCTHLVTIVMPWGLNTDAKVHIALICTGIRSWVTENKYTYICKTNIEILHRQRINLYARHSLLLRYFLLFEMAFAVCSQGTLNFYSINHVCLLDHSICLHQNVLQSTLSLSLSLSLAT